MSRDDRYKPFDHDNGRDIAAEHFRRQIVASFMDAKSIAVIRDLPAEQQLEALFSGSLVGMLGVGYLHATPARRATFTRFIRGYLLQAHDHATHFADNAIAEGARDEAAQP